MIERRERGGRKRINKRMLERLNRTEMIRGEGSCESGRGNYLGRTGGENKILLVMKDAGESIMKKGKKGGRCMGKGRTTNCDEEREQGVRLEIRIIKQGQESTELNESVGTETLRKRDGTTTPPVAPPPCFLELRGSEARGYWSKGRNARVKMKEGKVRRNTTNS